MFRNRRWASLIALFLSFALVAAACGDDDDADTSTDGDTSTTEDGSDGDDMAAGLPECLDFADLYALTGPESDGFTNWSDAQELATELGSPHALPDMDLTVAGPGEESGTYDTFVEFIFDEYAEDRGVEAAARSDYLSSPNDNIIVENLAAADGSLGWVGFAFFVENQDVLRAFEVSHDSEGVGCTSPTPDTIASGDYPLSRPLFIYVNDAKAAEKGSVSAYVDQYLSTYYDCVSSAGYVKLTDEALAETEATWEASGNSGGTDDGAEIVISGSSTVEPISQCVLAQTGQGGSVEGPGTGDGFQRFCNGETDISDASRAIKDSEAETCAAAGITYTELQVAIDGIAVMTAA